MNTRFKLWRRHLAWALPTAILLAGCNGGEVGKPPTPRYRYLYQH